MPDSASSAPAPSTGPGEACARKSKLRRVSIDAGDPADPTKGTKAVPAGASSGGDAKIAKKSEVENGRIAPRKPAEDEEDKSGVVRGAPDEASEGDSVSDEQEVEAGESEEAESDEESEEAESEEASEEDSEDEHEDEAFYGSYDDKAKMLSFESAPGTERLHKILQEGEFIANKMAIKFAAKQLRQLDLGGGEGGEQSQQTLVFEKLDELLPALEHLTIGSVALEKFHFKSDKLKTLEIEHITGLAEIESFQLDAPALKEISFQHVELNDAKGFAESLNRSYAVTK